MSHTFYQQTTKTTRVRSLFAAALVLACAFGTVSKAAAQNVMPVGNKKGPTGGNLLADTTFIQRLNTSGGAVPTSVCTVGQTQLVPYRADYFFFRADN